MANVVRPKVIESLLSMSPELFHRHEVGANRRLCVVAAYIRWLSTVTEISFLCDQRSAPLPMHGEAVRRASGFVLVA
jgi:hypothetical protein